jgi:hypothetical protein
VGPSRSPRATVLGHGRMGLTRKSTGGAPGLQGHHYRAGPFVGLFALVQRPSLRNPFGLEGNRGF